ncbi:spore germination protein [Paenibacillus koleovorans]|uniref:spore germination protein n=1 Tax=Paenibacillus koleovorans TaxID=121608 RepID=UPI0013E2ECEA|nr:spore germination protein [Paenibacillus koleovorans]
MTHIRSLQHAADLILLGYCLVLAESELDEAGDVWGTAVQVDSSFNRSIAEPQNEKVVRGSHEGFVEQLNINLNIIRRRATNTKLTVKYYYLGTETKTKTALVFIDEIVDPKLVRRVERRIKAIHADEVFSADFIEDLIEDNPLSLFPQLLHTERPDRVVANLLEGRVAVLMEGSPTSLIMPVSFISFYQSPDDFNARWMVGSFFRILRVFGFFLAITLPAVYIAVISFHLEVLPNDLVLPAQNAVRFVPFPPIVEALLLELTIELLREMGVRLPTPISQTIGIVGGLVIGEAVVQAGLVSSLMIIVVALTAIASYVVPSNEMSMAIRLVRFPFMVLASQFGFLGISFGMTLLFSNLCRLESFGVPYLGGFFSGSTFKDTLLRLPLWMLNKRPSFLHPRRLRRQTTTRGWVQDEQRAQASSKKRRS